MHLCCVSTPQTRICRSKTAASAFDNAAMTGLLYQEGVIFTSTFTHCVQFQSYFLRPLDALGEVLLLSLI